MPDSPDPSKKETYEKYQYYDDTIDSIHASKLNTYSSSSQDFDLRQASHPIICILTVFFKFASAFMFLFISPFINNQTNAYIIIILLVAIDFWFTKNISGRQLVGLIWTNKFNLEGDEIWVYESHQCAEASNSIDKTFFWTSNLLSQFFWFLMLVGDLLSLRLFWLGLSTFSTLLSAINTYSFYKCRGEHQKKLEEMKRELTKQGMNVVGMVMLNSRR